MNNKVNEMEDSNITKHRTHVIIVNSKIIDKATREAIRVTNTQTAELNYIILKYLEYCNLIDNEVRNMFKKDLLLSALKCYYSFNMHRTRDNMFNIKKTNALCLRYS